MTDMSTSTSTPPHQKHSRILACVLCQHRKIKCDRNTPCSNCVKANVTCTPSVPAPARKRRRPNQDLQERLARCEELLKQYAGVPPPQPGAAAATGPPSASRSEPVSPDRMESAYDHPTSTTNTNEEAAPWKGPGKMIKDETGVRFMDSYVWASIFDQLKEMKDIVDTEDNDDVGAGSSGDPSDRLTPENNTDLLLGVDTSDKSLQELQPDPIHAFRLWQLFLDRVNPLLKIVHVPSLNPYVMEGAVNINNVPLNYQALLFGIYAISTISMAEEEVPQILGTAKELAIRRYTSGLKLALIRFDCMKNHDMAALQAMLIYLITFQGRYDRHASWILSGTVVRMAQKMGYHRDGELLGLPPFETEMRRRIWWQILMIDVKYALMSGLNHSLLPINWNTKEPSNINDADLFPGLNEHVQSKDGPTEMAFVLIMNQVTMFMLNAASNPTFEAAMMGEPLMSEESQHSSDSSMSKIRNLLDDLVANLADIERKYVDPSAGPVHRSATSIRPLMADKMHEMLVSMEKPNTDGGIPLSRQDRLLRLLVINLEHNVAVYESPGIKEGHFLWYIKPHFQLEAFGVLCGMLTQKPLGPMADRAWASLAVVHQYHGELFDMTQKPMYQQAHFTIKAWTAREQALRSTGTEVSTPEYIQKLKSLCPVTESRANSTQASVSPVQPPPPQLTELDSFLGGYVDMSQFQWDTHALWNQPDLSQAPSAGMPDLGDFNMGNLSMRPNHTHMGSF